MRESTTISLKASDYDIKLDHLSCLCEEFYGHIIENVPPDDTVFMVQFDDKTSSEEHSQSFINMMNSTFKKI